MNGARGAERIILAEGRFGTVEYAARSSGAMEAREWLEAQSESTQRSFGVREGKIRSELQFRHLRAKVWEFKRSAHRLFCYREGSRCLLTHYYRKGGQKTPPQQISRAEQIGEEHIDRESNQAR